MPLYFVCVCCVCLMSVSGGHIILNYDEKRKHVLLACSNLCILFYWQYFWYSEENQCNVLQLRREIMLCCTFFHTLYSIRDAFRSVLYRLFHPYAMSHFFFLAQPSADEEGSLLQDVSCMDYHVWENAQRNVQMKEI